jgi:O-Antigen ligase
MALKPDPAPAQYAAQGEARSVVAEPTVAPSGVAHKAARVSWLQQYGPYALALYLLATTKWGSGVSPLGGPPYITDLVLMLLLIDRAVAAAAHRSTSTGVESWAGVVVSALLVWSLVLLAFGSVSQNALRDAAPYLYGVTVFLVRPPTASSESGTSRALMAVLVFHAAWVSLVQVFPSLATSTPIVYGGTHLLSIRTDVDSLVCGLLAAIGLHRALAGRNPERNLLLVGWGVTLVLLLNSRAGLLAFVVQIAVVLMLAPARRRLAGKYDARIAAAILLMCVPLILVGINQGNSVHRLSLAVSGNGAASEANGAIGTKNAREKSWKVLVQYIARDPARMVRGVGFGPDFLHDSGADALLLGTVAASQEDVRSPHNYLLNTWARLGLVGLLLTLGMILCGLRLARLVARNASRIRDDDVLAMLLVASIPLAALVGVVLESPFGALPYFWALGHLSARACQMGAVVPFGRSSGVRPTLSPDVWPAHRASVRARTSS